MREEHPNQQELAGVPTSGQSAQVVEMSEVAKLQSDVLPLGLVRESRPVFVYDANLAQQKSDNAVRQARFREKRAAKGLVAAQIPAEIAEKLKEAGGDWSKLTQVQAKEVRVEVPVEIIKTVEVIKEIPVEVIKTVEVIKEVRVDVPGPVQYVDKIVEIKVPGPVQYVDKIVEKQTLKLTSEQKNNLLLGQKIRALTGFKRFLVQKIVGF